jgi:hypothetical protein
VDLDLVLAFQEKAFVTAEGVFKSLGLVSRLPVDGRQVFRFREDFIQNRNLIAWSFYDPLKPIRQLDIVITTDLKGITTQVIKLEGASVKVASVESLIQMKLKAGRPQDLEDVRALRELHGDKRK